MECFLENKAQYCSCSSVLAVVRGFRVCLVLMASVLNVNSFEELMCQKVPRSGFACFWFAALTGFI